MKKESAIFGAGCFWCTEAVYQELKGVLEIEVGYAGGNVKNPGYREVTYGKTGHIEVAKISFDAEQISYEQLVDIFWTMHDPTSMDKQGADVGTQYRSVIFYENEEQKEIAEKSRDKAGKELFDKEIVTEIRPTFNYFPGEDYHQKYYSSNPDAGYCRVVIDPKVSKLRAHYRELLKH